MENYACPLKYFFDRYSIEIGYRHIDCAKIYLNEKEVGEVLNEVIGNKVKRNDLFIVGKVSFGQVNK